MDPPLHFCESCSARGKLNLCFTIVILVYIEVISPSFFLERNSQLVAIIYRSQNVSSKELSMNQVQVSSCFKSKFLRTCKYCMHFLRILERKRTCVLFIVIIIIHQLSCPLNYFRACSMHTNIILSSNLLGEIVK